MMLQRFNPLVPVTHFRNEIDRLFSNAFGENLGHRTEMTFPALNVWQDERNIFVEAEVPGMKLEDLTVFVEGGQLTIKGEVTREETENAEFITRERIERKFNRMVRLPVPVDADHVNAKLRDGVLMVTLPKASEVLPKRIEVQG